jgi:tetratricopeptide (TPR) repeat protein
LMRGQSTNSARHLDRALVVNPDSDLAWIYLSRVRMRCGCPELAIPLMENAQLLSPLPKAFALHRGLAFLLARRHREAVALLEETERAGVATPHTRAMSALALLRLGRVEESLAKARGALDPVLKAGWSVGMNAWTDGLVAWALAEAGRRDEAGKLVDEILRLSPEYHFNAGCAVGIFGDCARAFELLTDVPQWLVDHVLLFEQETGRLGKSAGFHPLLKQLDALDAWQTLQREMRPDIS